MLFNLELELKKDRINKDKNRMFISLFKHSLENYDEEYYKSLYEIEANKIKSFTFSLYMPNCQFEREEIFIPNKKIILNFSTNSVKDSIYFYNSFQKQIGKPYQISNNEITIKRIRMVKEKLVIEDSCNYKTISPIVVSDHNGNNHETWYYSLNEEKGKEIFLRNLKYQLLEEFGEERKLDIQEVKFKVIRNKEVKVKHYGIEILSNIATINIQAKPYILQYLYMAGILSRRSQGFGMVDLA